MKPATHTKAHPFHGYDCGRRLASRQVYRRYPAGSIATLSKIKSSDGTAAQFTFDLGNLLEQAADEKNRANIMRRMQRAIEGDT